MPEQVRWLDDNEDRAWRAFRHSNNQLSLRLNLHLVQDSELTMADYEVLAALSAEPTGRLPAQVLCAQMRWEKSRLSHQVRRMQQAGLLRRSPNPADARSVIICLTPRGRRAIEAAAPKHVSDVRRHFVDLLTAEELETLAAISERILGHLATESGAEPSDEPTAFGVEKSPKS